MKKTCIICKQEFEARDKRVVCCKNKECRKQYNHLKYKARTVKCICENCGKVYFATDKQKHNRCPDCTRAEHYEYRHTVEQKHCCRQCHKVMFTQIKNVTRGVPEFMYDVTCDECKKKIYAVSSDRMKMDNPNPKAKKYNSVAEADEAAKHRKIEYVKRKKRKYASAEEQYKAASERMKKDNPMFRAEVRRKAHESLMKRIRAGTINYNRQNSARYKGDRGIKNYIRISLSWWREENLARAGYKCENCGASRAWLQVHHLEKFSDIVERFATQLNLDLKTLQYASDDYKKLEQLVNEYHKTHNIGMALCENCHDKIDKCYHKRKLEKRKDKAKDEGDKN